MTRSAYRGAREDFTQAASGGGGAVVEASWEPVAAPSSGVITVDPTGCLGRWAKAGNIVSVWFQVQVTSVAGPGGTLRITGLPAGQGLAIPAGGVEAAMSVFGQNMTAGTNPLMGRVLANEDPPVLRLYGFTAGNPVLLAPFVQANTFLWGFAQWTVLVA